MTAQPSDYQPAEQHFYASSHIELSIPNNQPQP
jgi:hypothetical protein